MDGEVSQELSPRVWVPSLAERIVSFLPPNEIACSIRTLNKASSVQFRSRQHRTVHLSQPCLPAAFAWRWAFPGSARQLPYHLRVALVRLTAASGVIANLRVAIDAAGCVFDSFVVERAAQQGHLEVLKRLYDEGYLKPSASLLTAAARGGRESVIAWLLASGVEFCSDAVSEAARGGHVDTLRWLMLMWREKLMVNPDHQAEYDRRERHRVIKWAVQGCDLACLQQILSDWANGAFFPAFGVKYSEDQLRAEAALTRELQKQKRQLSKELATAQARLSALTGPRQQLSSRSQRAPGQQQQQQQQGEEEAERMQAELVSARRHAADLAERFRTLRQQLELGATIRTLSPREREGVIASAASSFTPDWREKVTWLEEVGFTQGPDFRAVEVVKYVVICSARPSLKFVVAQGRMAQAAGTNASAAAIAAESSSPPGDSDNSGGNCSSNSSSNSSSSNGGAPALPQPAFQVQLLSEYQQADSEVVTRLRWLKERGYPSVPLKEVLTHGGASNIELLRHTLSELRASGQPVVWDRRLAVTATLAMESAAREGCWEVVAELLSEGLEAEPESILHDAASEGHLRVLQWWDELVSSRQADGQQAQPQQGEAGQGAPAEAEAGAANGVVAAQQQPGVRQDAAPAWIYGALWHAAAVSGSLELLRWMYDRCGSRVPFSASIFVGAAAGGNEEALDWLLERGCPMGDDGEPYVAAAGNGDLATLRHLRRVGCPWGPVGTSFARCVYSKPTLGRHPLVTGGVEVLRCLLQEGCPVDWPAAEAAALERRRAFSEYGGEKSDEAVKMVLWLAEQHRRQAGH